MSNDRLWPKMISEELIDVNPMTGSKVPEFTTFVFPIIKHDPNKKPEPVQEYPKPRIPEGLRCPGCCGPVVVSYFEGYNYPPDHVRPPYNSYTCGKFYPNSQCTDVGPHGSLGYIDVDDERPVQAAVDAEFARRQESRQQDLDDFKKSGAESVTFTRGCGTVVIYVPNGPLPATTHGVNCKCVRPTT